LQGGRRWLVLDLPEVRVCPIEAVRFDLQRALFRRGRLKHGAGRVRVRTDLKRQELLYLQVAGKKGSDTEAGPSREKTDPFISSRRDSEY
jgi:hypothetical protein